MQDSRVHVTFECPPEGTALLDGLIMAGIRAAQAAGCNRDMIPGAVARCFSVIASWRQDGSLRVELGVNDAEFRALFTPAD